MTAPTRVIVVDDNPVVVTALRELLADEGFDVVGDAGDAESAVEVAARELPDVALVDMGVACPPRTDARGA